MPIRTACILISVTLLAASCAPSAPPAPKKSAVPEGASGVVDAYRTWVLNQTDTLVAQTEAFTSAVNSANRSQAQALYAPTRAFYEKIEPVAEALGDLDPRIDGRENDVPADQWGGFHSAR